MQSQHFTVLNLTSLKAVLFSLAILRLQFSNSQSINTATERSELEKSQLIKVTGFILAYAQAILYEIDFIKSFSSIYSCPIVPQVN